MDAQGHLRSKGRRRRSLARWPPASGSRPGSVPRPRIGTPGAGALGSMGETRYPTPRCASSGGLGAPREMGGSLHPLTHPFTRSLTPHPVTRPLTPPLLLTHAHTHLIHVSTTDNYYQTHAHILVGLWKLCDRTLPLFGRRILENHGSSFCFHILLKLLEK